MSLRVSTTGVLETRDCTVKEKKGIWECPLCRKVVSHTVIKAEANKDKCFTYFVTNF